MKEHYQTILEPAHALLVKELSDRCLKAGATYFHVDGEFKTSDDVRDGMIATSIRPLITLTTEARFGQTDLIKKEFEIFISKAKKVELHICEGLTLTLTSVSEDAYNRREEDGVRFHLRLHLAGKMRKKAADD